MSVMLAVTMMPVNVFAAIGTDASAALKTQTKAAMRSDSSYFTVKFKYGDGNWYGFSANELNECEFFLWEILNDVLPEVSVKDVTEVTSSDQERVEPFGNNTTGNLAVRVSDFFYGTEYLYVTAGSVTYEIEVCCEGDGVVYIDENGEYQERYKYTSNPHQNLTDGWYVIDRNLTELYRVEVTGDVNLIVCNGVKAYYLRGIHVPKGSSLTIYGQRGNTGELICQEKPQFKYEGDEYECSDAGIGGDDGEKERCGDITINGATVLAGGGIHHSAAIGGADAQPNGKITINGGIVNAKVKYGGHTGEGFAEEVYAAAIGTGGGWNTQSLKETPGEITINGGNVTAIAANKAFGAAIGSGYYIKGGPKITINGGVVNAYSATGAAIGGGERSSGYGDIIINGGSVHAVSTGKGAGIGGGFKRKGGNITINDGYVSAVGGGLKQDYYDSIEFYKKSNLPNPAIEANDTAQVGSWVSLLADFLLPLFATGEWGGAGIGGGDDGAGGNVTINGGVVVATAGMNSAQAIGHGDGGSGNGSISMYDYAQVTYGKLDDKNIVIKGTEAHGDPDDRAKVCRDYAYVKIGPGECSVRFDVQGHGTAPETQVVTGGQSAVEPDDPVAEGYLFAGWYMEEECITEYNFEAPVKDPVLTLYAKWVRTGDLTVKKEWPDGADAPESVRLEYTVLQTTAPDDEIITGEATLSASNGWSGAIGITEECVFEIKEPLIEGYLTGSWVLSGHDAAGNEVIVTLPVNDSGWARLDLQNQKTSGLNAEDFNKALAAVKAGNAELTITNVRSKVFSVVKQWDDSSSSYRPGAIQTVLQKKQQDGYWKTIETVELTGENSWRKSFKAVEDLGTENAKNYRIRELDKNGAPVLDKNDRDGDGKDPVATLQAYINGTLTDIDYDVTYGTLTDNGTVNITNRAGTVFSVKINWEDYRSRPDTAVPESVEVSLYIRNTDGSLSGVGVLPKQLNEANGWQAVFPRVEDGNDYVIREVDANNYTVFDDGEVIPANYYGAEHNKARFTICEYNKTNDYSYDVTYASDDDTRHTVITNKRTGILLKVKKVWEAPDGSKWTDWADQYYSTYAVLQHRVKDAAGNVKWETVGDRIKLGQNGSWEEELPVIPLTDGTAEDDYRVRELVRQFTHGKGNHPQYWPFVTYFDTEPDDYIDSYGKHYKLMLASGDEDNADHDRPVFNAEYDNVDVFESTFFGVSYDRDADGNFVIKNKQQSSACDHEWEFSGFSWTGDEAEGYTAAVAEYTCRNDDSHKEQVTKVAVSEATTAPDCENKGKTEYTASVAEKDSLDGQAHEEIKSAKFTDALGHSWDRGVITKQSTCAENGEKTYTCTVCGTQEVRYIAKKPHDYVFTEWTWKGNETDGYTEATVHYECSECGRTEFWIIEPQKYVVEPTCTEGGKTVYKAQISSIKAFDDLSRSERKEAKFTDPLGHDYHEVADSGTPATCTQAGREADVECSRCGDVICGAAIPATGHSWSEWDAWTTGGADHQKRICEICDAEEEIIIEEDHEHNVDLHYSEGTPATCTTNGVRKHYECNCGYWFEEGPDGAPSGDPKTSDEFVIKASGHTSGDPVKENIDAATCTENGSYESVIYCTKCNTELSRINCTITAFGHTFGELETEDEIPATCTEDGSYDEVVKCTVCGTETDREHVVIPATGHDWDDGVVTREATASEEGVKLFTCLVCGESRTETIPKIESFTVTFKAAGGIWSDETTADKQVTVEKGQSATAPANPTRDGYTFDGWDKDFSNVTEDLTVTAQWKENTTPTPEPEPTPDPGSDPNQKGKDGTATGEGASAAAAEKAITNMKSDTDPKGSVFRKLTLKSPKQTTNSITLNWTKQSKAVKYVIYGNKCGKTAKPKKIATIKNNKMVTKKITKVAGKKLKKNTYYKFIIVALDRNNNVVSTSSLIHVATKGGKYTNYKSVSVKKSVLTKAKKLKKGKMLKLNATGVKTSKKLTAKKHVAIRYESSNPKIATVTKKGGKVTAKKKGTCYIYAYAQNGMFRKIKVTVK